jgi:hypothetical protein
MAVWKSEKQKTFFCSIECRYQQDYPHLLANHLLGQKRSLKTVPGEYV